MPETRISVQTGPKEHRSLDLSFGGPNQTFRLNTEKVEANALTPLDDLARDFLEIAAAVFAADGFARRGGSVRSGFGADWRRSFTLSIAVVRLEVWDTPEMREALAAAAEFLSDDRFEFRFVESARSRPPLDLLPFGGESRGFMADEVVLFSGGLDSLAGALDTLADTAKNVVLITHRSAQKSIPYQTDLAAQLKRRFGRRVAPVFIRATRVGGRGEESTQRTRSFLFTALGFAAAQAYGARRIRFFENGVVSWNLPISPQVIGTMATRTTHPAALRKLARILELIANSTANPLVSLDNPFEWLTKREVIERIVARDGGDLIKDAVSCTVVFKRKRQPTHCGECSQCLDRRFAVVAAGLEHFDPEDRYRVPVFLGERSERDASRTLAVDWFRHADGLATSSPEAFAGRFASELQRAGSTDPSRSPEWWLNAAHDLHRRHGQSVARAAEIMIGRNFEALRDGTLVPTSLLRMLVDVRHGAPKAAKLAPVPQPRRAPQPERAAPGRHGGYEVLFDLDGGDHLVEVLDLATVRGAPAEVAHGLKVRFDEDRKAGLRVADYTYVNSGRVLLTPPKNQRAVIRLVERFRRSLADAYEAIEGHPPHEHLIIEGGPTGYRLDPTIIVVAPTASRKRRG